MFGDYEFRPIGIINDGFTAGFYICEFTGPFTYHALFAMKDFDGHTTEISFLFITMKLSWFLVILMIAITLYIIATS